MSEMLESCVGAKPPFEEMNESRAVSQTQECTVLIVDGKPFISKGNSDNYGIILDLEVQQHPDPKAKAKRMRVWLLFTTRMAFKVKNAMGQCGLDYIQRLYDAKHPEFDPEDRPVLDLSDDDDRNRLGQFYLTGQLVDNESTEFDCPHGGLIGKTIQVTIGPLEKDDEGEDRTGSITPLKAGN